MKNDNNISNLENEEEFLLGIKKENNFNTPPNYFDDLPELLMVKKSSNNNLGLSKNLYRFILPTAAFVIIALIIFNFNETTKTTQISDEQLSEFLINEEYEYFEDELIYEAYINNVSTESNTSENDENYIDYLIDNDVDINTIIEEL